MFLELDSLDSLDSYIWHEFTNTYDWVVATGKDLRENPEHKTNSTALNVQEYADNYELYKQFDDDLHLIHKAIKERIEENKKQRDKIKEVLEILNIATKDDFQ